MNTPTTIHFDKFVKRSIHLVTPTESKMKNTCLHVFKCRIIPELFKSFLAFSMFFGVFKKEKNETHYELT